MKKLVIIINGVGGSGKDTICDLAAKHFKVVNVSSIDPIKKIAKENGWDGEKDSRSRKFLSDLKKAFVEYNDLPTWYLFDEFGKFCVNDSDVFFAHIREADEIDKFKKIINGRCPIITLLIVRDTVSGKIFGNKSDDLAHAYNYDICIDNNGTLEDAEKAIVELIDSIIKNI